MKTRIVLLHGPPIAMQPVQTALKDNRPEAETINQPHAAYPRLCVQSVPTGTPKP